MLYQNGLRKFFKIKQVVPLLIYNKTFYKIYHPVKYYTNPCYREFIVNN